MSDNEEQHNEQAPASNQENRMYRNIFIFQLVL